MIRPEGTMEKGLQLRRDPVHRPFRTRDRLLPFQPPRGWLISEVALRPIPNTHYKRRGTKLVFRRTQKSASFLAGDGEKEIANATVINGVHPCFNEMVPA